MNLKKLGIILGLVGVLVLPGCQGQGKTQVNQESDSAGQEEKEAVDAQENQDYSKGFATSKEALDAYMTEIIAKDYAKAYEALHQVDKDTFTSEDFVAYQASMQLAKDLHGYGVHDEQSFRNFDFAGKVFEQVNFYDLDLAYVEAGSDPLPVDESDEHDHETGTDYHSHDHGHEMATVGLAVVKRNGEWYVLQGLSQYELRDLTRKYTNQSLSLKMQEEDTYALGQVASVGNMLVSVNEVTRSQDKSHYTLDVSIMNAGFDPLDTDHFVSKFAMIDDKMENSLSQPVDRRGALNGVVRPGSYTRGLVKIPVSQSFETDQVHFLLNTIDPSRKPLVFNIKESVSFEMDALYDQMKRKPEASVEEKAFIDGIVMAVNDVKFEQMNDQASEGQAWERMTLSLELNGLTDEVIHTNQLMLTARTADGVTVSLHDQFENQKIEGVTSISESFECPVKRNGQPLELTLSIRDTRPNNSVTFKID